MSDTEKSKNSDKSSQESCCYHVVDACGCIVGTYCCDGPDMSSCRFCRC